MKKTIAITVSSLALALSAPALAQDADVDAQDAATEEAQVDPARLAAAETTVDYLFPLGTYERMMKGTMDQMMDAMFSSIGDMTMGDMAGASGLPDDGMTEEEKATSINAMARQADPHFDERMKISTKVMMDEMVDLMSAMEPQIRTTLSSIYARKYTTAQLTEMNSFFKTDTGTAFARDYMMVFVDPEMMQSMVGMVPEMMGAMPDIMKKVEDATKHLPPPLKSEEEQMMEAAGDAAEAAADAAEAMAEDLDEESAWNKAENWSEEDRAIVEKTEAASDAAFQKYYEVLEKARANAKAKLKKGE